VRFKGGAEAWRRGVKRALRAAPQPKGAKLHVVGERRHAHELGKRTAREAPVVVHLEKPVARMYPALHEVQVMLVVGANVRDAFIVDRDSCRALQARKALRRFSQYCCANTEKQRKRESSQHDDSPLKLLVSTLAPKRRCAHPIAMGARGALQRERDKAECGGLLPRKQPSCLPQPTLRRRLIDVNVRASACGKER